MVGRTFLSRLSWRAESPICRSCLRHWQRCHASVSAAVTATAESTSAPPPGGSPSEALASPRPAFGIKAGVVLSRPPQITRDLTPFEKQYFFYQRRLNERQVLPFTRYFYYQQDTPADIQWKRKMKERQIPARDVGEYNPYGREGWNDEVVMGEGASGPAEQMEILLQDSVSEQVEEVDVKEGESDEEAERVAKRKIKEETLERPYPRVSEADRAGDLKSLNRALSRTLYLLVREGQGAWRFPSSELENGEDLVTAAERLLVQAGGINMNTWILGHAPVGHLVRNFAASDGTLPEKLGEKTFFMKGRIMAGRPSLAGNSLNLSDFKWLAKEEIQGEVSPKYWKAIKPMLVEL